jgi:hypothetical protein
MKLTHACGHVVEYKSVKDKASLAARSCPACEHAARRAAPTPAPRTLYGVPTVRPGSKSIIIVTNESDGVASHVQEFPSDQIPSGYAPFETREAAEAHVRELVASGQVTFVSSGRTQEEALAENRAMLAMQAEDNRVGRERTDEALTRPRTEPRFNPEAEDADEVLFGIH